VPFVRRIRGHKDADYYVKITVSEGSQDDTDEIAGPLCTQAQNGREISSHLGNLRVHVHRRGVQIWMLGLSMSAQPEWQRVPIPVQNFRHPRLSDHYLSLWCGEGTPAWVTKKTITTYAKRQHA
jgi:hypothetical protein